MVEVSEDCVVVSSSGSEEELLHSAVNQQVRDANRIPVIRRQGVLALRRREERAAKYPAQPSSLTRRCYQLSPPVSLWHPSLAVALGDGRRLRNSPAPAVGSEVQGMNWSSEVHVVDTWFPALEAFVPGWEKFLEPHTLRVWFCSRDSGEHFFEDEPGRWRPFFPTTGTTFARTGGGTQTGTFGFMQTRPEHDQLRDHSRMLVSVREREARAFSQAT